MGMQIYKYDPCCAADLGSPYGGVTYFAYSPPWLSAARNWGEVAKGIQSLVPIKRRVYQGPLISGNDNIAVCLVYRLAGTVRLLAADGMKFCATSDLSPPSSQVWCEPITGAINFNYGAISSAELDGLQKSANYTAWCNRNVTAKIYARNLSNGRLYLRPDKSLYADLTINNKELDTGVIYQFKEGIYSTFTIRSILGSTGNIETGSFNGSTIVYIDII